jgi:hypothetical protein
MKILLSATLTLALILALTFSESSKASSFSNEMEFEAYRAYLQLNGEYVPENILSKVFEERYKGLEVYSMEYKKDSAQNILGVYLYHKPK